MSAGGIACWLLHKRPYLHGRNIWELLSDRGERLAVLARPRSRRGAFAAPALCDRVRVWYRGRRDLPTLQRFEAECSAGLGGRALLYALAANELLVRCTHRGDCHSELPVLYRTWLDGLIGAEDEHRRRGVHIRMQLKLLAMTGYGLDLSQDAHGNRVLAHRRYRLGDDFRLLPAADDRGGWDGEALLEIAKGEPDSEQSLCIGEAVATRLLKVAAGGKLRGHELLAVRSSTETGERT